MTYPTIQNCFVKVVLSIVGLFIWRIIRLVVMVVIVIVWVSLSLCLTFLYLQFICTNKCDWHTFICRRILSLAILFNCRKNDSHKSMMIAKKNLLFSVDLHHGALQAHYAHCLDGLAHEKQMHPCVVLLSWWPGQKTFHIEMCSRPTRCYHFCHQVSPSVKLENHLYKVMPFNTFGKTWKFLFANMQFCTKLYKNIPMNDYNRATLHNSNASWSPMYHHRWNIQEQGYCSNK